MDRHIAREQVAQRVLVELGADLGQEHEEVAAELGGHFHLHRRAQLHALGLLKLVGWTWTGFWL